MFGGGGSQRCSNESHSQIDYNHVFTPEDIYQDQSCHAIGKRHRSNVSNEGVPGGQSRM